MNIYVIRHGQTDWNVQGKLQGKTDTYLNDVGIQQAKDAAEKLKNENIDIIISSPLKRAKMTANIINEQFNVPLVVNEGIMERGFGKLEGREKHEINFESLWDKTNIERANEIEAIDNFYDRVYTCMDEIKKQYPNKNILLVTHGGVGIPLDQYLSKDNDKESDILSNCSYKKYEI